MVTSKLFESRCPVLFNLNREVNLSVAQLFCSKANLLVANENVKKCLNHLINAYQGNDEKEASVSEILKLREIPPLLNDKIKIIENIKSLNDFGTCFVSFII